MSKFPKRRNPLQSGASCGSSTNSSSVSAQAFEVKGRKDFQMTDSKSGRDSYEQCPDTDDQDCLPLTEDSIESARLRRSEDQEKLPVEENSAETVGSHLCEPTDMEAEGLLPREVEPTDAQISELQTAEVFEKDDLVPVPESPATQGIIPVTADAPNNHSPKGSCTPSSKKGGRKSKAQLDKEEAIFEKALPTMHPYEAMKIAGLSLTEAMTYIAEHPSITPNLQLNYKVCKAKDILKKIGEMTKRSIEKDTYIKLELTEHGVLVSVVGI
jgi:hypothetical protein